MIMKKIFLPICDYFCTRKRVLLKFIFPILCAGLFITLSFIIPITEAVDVMDIFSDFINAQISMIAIFISFSIAIISILVSADNPNIQRLRTTESKDGSIKPIKGQQLTLFQVLLTNLTYNVFVEVLYLVALIVFLIIRAVIPISTVRYLIAFNIFCIIHVLHILIETVVQMYHTFWRA